MFSLSVCLSILYSLSTHTLTQTKLRGPLAPQSDQGIALPFVLLLGNHSSGKSSFLNYVIGRSVQTTGVAPTDDCFTIVAPGPYDHDQDGPAVIGDPDLGFMSLRQFGPTLMNHVQLKIRCNIHTNNFVLVDTPGMIDAPGNYMLQQQQQDQHHQQNSNFTNNNDSSTRMTQQSMMMMNMMDRGYDFTGVVRWFADRADVVLLFFDPDKPGTTGETLGILLHALSGMDHKLFIVLNKADQFNKLHDFARSYGSLCWNLSKVILRKDLPRIYTMCLPIHNMNNNNKDDDDKDNNSTRDVNEESTFLGGDHQTTSSTLQDLYTARDEVVSEVFKAPARRMDNWITNLYDSVSQLHMYTTILQDIQQRYRRLYWHYKGQEMALLLIGSTITALVASWYGYGNPQQDIANVVATTTTTTTTTPPPPWLDLLLATLCTTTIVSTGGLWWYHGQQLLAWQQTSYQHDELLQTFLSTHTRAIQEGDEYMASVWQRIKPCLVLALQQQQVQAQQVQQVQSLPHVTKDNVQQLQDILQNDIPRLRRLASPSHYGKDKE